MLKVWIVYFQVVISPRKNEVIQSVRSHKRTYNSTEPINYNLRNQNNIFESKYSKNTNENKNTRSNIPYDYSKSSISKYEPKT